VATVTVKLNLQESTLAEYEKRGSLDKVLSDHLTSTLNFTSTKPLYFTDTQRKRMDRLFGRNFKSSEDLIMQIEKYITARIGEVDIQLQPSLLARLKTRCFGKPFETFLAERIIIGLEEYTGMR
jgi:hypothetical protein